MFIFDLNYETKNMKLFIFIALCSIFIQAQNNISDYPEGIYNTFEDFKKMKPKDLKSDFFIQIGRNKISHKFYYKSNNKKLKKVFALSYKNNLYINLKYLMKNLNRDSHGQM